MEYYLDEHTFEFPNNKKLDHSIETLLEHSKNKSRFRKKSLFNLCRWN